jgi:hypothetical protein
MLDRPALNLVPIIDDDEPAPSKSDLDRREIQRKCLKHWGTVYHMLIAQNGRSMIEHLGPNFKPRPNGEKRHGAPRIVEMMGPSPNETNLGYWCNRGGDGASGNSLFELVMYLGECDMKTATTFLKDLSDRLVELPK